MASDNTISEVLGSENARQVLVFVDDESTITALGGHQLGRFNDENVFSNGQGLSRTQGRDSAGNLFRVADTALSTPLL